MQLNIEITFPFGRFHGNEFPPSPTRFFQALIAGTHRGIYEKQNVDVRSAAFEWFEKLAPPLIVSCNFTESSKGTNNFVPNNDNGREPKKYNQTFRLPWLHEKSATKSMQAFVLQDEAKISLLWNFPDTDENKRNAEVICKMARLVTHLGHGQDSVFACGEIVENDYIESADNSRIIFRPKLQEGGKWTVPTVGSLVSYKRRYREFLRTGNSHTFNAAVRQVEYVSDDTIDLSCPYALFEMWQLEDDNKRLSFDGRFLRQPAAMLRHAVSKFFASPKGARFKKFYGEDVISRKVFGHNVKSVENIKICADEAHLAFIPLPNLYPDGKIRRILLAGFNFETDVERELFEDIAKNLNGAEIKDAGQPIGKILRVSNLHQDAVFPKIYGNQSKIWRSITPIVLSGFNRRGRKPEHLIYRALNQIGIGNDAIESVAIFRSPLVPKTFRPPDYKIASNDYLNESPRYHAEIIFKRPVRGVLVVGRGRHAGFGLMMPII